MGVDFPPFSPFLLKKDKKTKKKTPLLPPNNDKQNEKTRITKQSPDNPLQHPLLQDICEDHLRGSWVSPHSHLCYTSAYFSYHTITPLLTPLLVPEPVLTLLLTPVLTLLLTPQTTPQLTIIISQITPLLTTLLTPQLTPVLIPQLTLLLTPQLTPVLIPQLILLLTPQLTPWFISQITPSHLCSHLCLYLSSHLCSHLSLHLSSHLCLHFISYLCSDPISLHSKKSPSTPPPPLQLITFDVWTTVILYGVIMIALTYIWTGPGQSDDGHSLMMGIATTDRIATGNLPVFHSELLLKKKKEKSPQLQQ